VTRPLDPLALARLHAHPAFLAVRRFADLMLRCGRDEYWPVQSPLFVCQLNAYTLSVPAGTPDDPGMFLGNSEYAGVQPTCQNLLYDQALLDVLGLLTRLTGDRGYDDARRAHLEHLLTHCLHPVSGFIPWGEHVGYDLSRDEIVMGDVKGGHEVRITQVAWDQLWEVNPEVTRHEISVALRNHICDEATFAYNRHAAMDGTPNSGATDLCSLSCSGGLYMRAWAWLYARTGEARYLDWAQRMAEAHWRRRGATGLFPTDEHRFSESWYVDAPEFAVHLLHAADDLGDEGVTFREQALAYLLAYRRYAFDPDGGVFDTIQTETGEPVEGLSAHCPADAKPSWVRAYMRPRHLQAWKYPFNSGSLAMLTSVLGQAHRLTGEPAVREMLDTTIGLLDIPGHVAAETRMGSGDAAGVIFAHVYAAERSGDSAYLAAARPLVEYMLRRNRVNGILTSGYADTDVTWGRSWDASEANAADDGRTYYFARFGSPDLALALLAYVLCECGLTELVPQVRVGWCT
jgi:hypothetical protein